MRLIYQQPYHLLFVFITLLMQQLKCFQFTNLVVTADSTIINTLTTYQFDFDRTIDNNFQPTAYSTVLITSISTAIINFPSVYTLSTVSCIISVNEGSQFSPTCSVSGHQIIISNFVTNTTGVGIGKMSVWISNILNPSPAITTDYFTGSIGSDTSGSGNFGSYIILQPGTFSFCSSTFNPTTVNSTGNMIISIVPTNQINSTGYIIINFPSGKRWINDISTTNYMPINSIMSCSSLSSNVQSSIQCTGNSFPPTVTASNLFIGPNSANFSFSINNFLSPPTNQQSDVLTATSYSSTGNKIDTCNFYVSGLTPTTITNMNITNSLGGSMIVNQYYTLRIIFVLPDTLSQTDTLTLVLPTGSVINYISSTVATNFSASVNNIIASYSTGTQTFFMSIANSSVILPKSSIIFINIGSYQAPPSIQPTQNFVLSFYRNSAIKMTGTAYFTAIPSTISGLVSSAASTTVNANTSYTFQITTFDAITSTGSIKIYIPSTITILTSSANCATASGSLGSNIALSPVCIFNPSQNSIAFSSLSSSSSSILAQTISITVAGLKNPSSAIATGNFSARSYYRSTSASLVATGTVTGITATPALIDNSIVSVTADSLVVNAYAVSYTLQYKIINTISVGGYFTILMPPQIAVDLTSISSSCSININSTSYVLTACSGMANANGSVTINFTNPFSSDANTNTVVMAKISTLFTNPTSTRPTSSFHLYTFSSNGAIVAYINTALTIQMTTFAAFNSISLSRTSNKNYDLATYTFVIAQHSPYQVSSAMIITFPNNVVPSGASACSISTVSISTTTVTCNYVASTLTITLPASIINSGVAITININNVRNPASFQPTGTFTIQSKTFNSLYTYSYQMYTPTNLTNTIPTSFNSLTYSFTPTIYGQPTSLQINFSPSLSTQLPSRLRLSLASSFTVSNLRCVSFVDFAGTCNAVSTNTIDIVGNFSNSIMSFSVSGFVSPIDVVTDYTSLVTFNTNNYQLDQSTNVIKFAISCTFPCRTCSLVNTTMCISCYTLINTTFIYYDSLLSQCLSSCAPGKFINTVSFTCDLCNTNCLTCVTSATFCLTCNQSSSYKYLYANNATTPATQTCQLSCPTRMYPDQSQAMLCVNCISPCYTCTTSAICLTCVSGTYLFNNTCSTTCPTGYYVANPTTNNCDACSTSCVTCSILITNCTSCVSPLLIYQNQCRTTCPSPLVPQNGTCGACDLSCLTCSNQPLNCTSCNTASLIPYLYNNHCQSTCPQGYYKNLGLGACSLCSSVIGLNCNDCASVSTCNICNPGYVLLNQTCLNYVPNGYVNISNVAQPCIGDCQTCSINTNNCTSCINYNLLNYNCYQVCPTGYIGITHICQHCVSPCASCSTTMTSCTSCLTLTPRLYLSNTNCLAICPDGTYASNVNNSCVNCVSPCQYCSSSVACLTCLNGFYLVNSTCMTQCNAGYAGINRICQPCQNYCATCQNSTTLCLTCVANTYLYQLNSSCVTSCGAGLYVDPLNHRCVYCIAPCKTCTNTSTTCLSCLTGTLYNYGCPVVCPSQYFNQSGICQQCPSQCLSCSSLSSCNTCNNGFYLYNSFCVATCPATFAIIVGQTCTQCSGSNCHECTAADVCTMCDNKYSLLNGACLNTCPAGYNSNGTHCIDINQEALTTTPNSFPVPFSIAAAVILVACLMSKLQFGKTFLPGAVFAFLGLLQCGALAYFLYLYFNNLFTSQPLPFFIGISSLVYLCLLNFIAFLVQNIIFCNDKQFNVWSSHCPNRCSIFWINLISLVINHKFRNILFCKLFTFAVFSAQLESVSKFKVLNIFSFLSLLHSGAAIFAAAISIASTEKQSQLFYQCIDVIIITALNGLLAFFNVMKPNDFFYEMTPEGFELKRRSKVEDEYSPNKVDPTGKQDEDEQGFYSNVNHVQNSNNKQELTAGLMTTHPFKKDKIKLYSVSSIKDQQSFGSLNQHQHHPEKQYADISIQALQMIDDKSFQTHKPQQKILDFDAAILPKQQQHSKFTTIFDKSDKGIGVSFRQYSDRGVGVSFRQPIDKSVGISFGQPSDKGIQNTIDHGPSVKEEGVQMEYQQEKPQVHDISIQQSYVKMVDQSIQRFDSISPVDRSIQRTIFFKEDQSMQYAESMKTKPPSMKDASISNMKASVKDISVSNIQPTLIDISISNIQPSVRDISITNMKVSVEDKSVQQVRSITNKSVMYQPSVKDQQNQKTIELIDQQIQNKPQEQNQEIQAVQDQSQKGLQKDISVDQKSVQFEQSVKDRSIQHQNLVQFDQFNEDMHPSKTNQIIIEQNQKQQIPIQQNQLKEQETEQFLLPKQEIKSYQQELEQRIRDKEKQLTKIKRKIELQQKKNQQKKSKVNKIPKFYDNSNQMGGIEDNSNSIDNPTINNDQSIIYKKNINQTNQPLKKQFKQVEEEVDAQIDKTIQQIEVINDEGEKKNIKVEFNNERQPSKVTQQQFLGMLQQHPNKVIFDNSSNQQENQNSDQINKIILNSKSYKPENSIANQNNPPNKKLAKYEQSSAQINSGKDWSTKIYSSNKPLTKTDKQRPKPQTNQKNRDFSDEDNIYDPIISRPIYPYQPHSFSDMSQTIQEVHPNLNQTTQTTYLKNQSVKHRVKQVIPSNNNRNRKQIPQQRVQQNIRRKFQFNSNASIPRQNKYQPQQKNNNRNQRKSTLLFAGKSQFAEERLAPKETRKNSPLKTSKKWEYQHEDKNIQQSGGEEEIGYKRPIYVSRLSPPMETDKQLIDFKTSKITASQYIRVPHENKILPKKQIYGATDQISPFIGQLNISQSPKKPKFSRNQIPSSDFGTNEEVQQPYIEQQQLYVEQQSQSDYLSLYKNNMILGQMLDRPANSQLQDYYGRKKRSSKSKQKSRNSSFNQLQTETEKIYQQRLNPNRRK